VLFKEGVLSECFGYARAYPAQRVSFSNYFKGFKSGRGAGRVKHNPKGLPGNQGARAKAQADAVARCGVFQVHI
jgi:hypothetical protein